VAIVYQASFIKGLACEQKASVVLDKGWGALPPGLWALISILKLSLSSKISVGHRTVTPLQFAAVMVCGYTCGKIALDTRTVTMPKDVWSLVEPWLRMDPDYFHKNFERETLNPASQLNVGLVQAANSARIAAGAMPPAS